MHACDLHCLSIAFIKHEDCIRHVPPRGNLNAIQWPSMYRRYITHLCTEIRNISTGSGHLEPLLKLISKAEHTGSTQVLPSHPWPPRPNHLAMCSVGEDYAIIMLVHRYVPRFCCVCLRPLIVYISAISVSSGMIRTWLIQSGSDVPAHWKTSTLP